MLKRLLFLFLTVPSLLIFNNLDTPKYPNNFYAKVIGIKDGDTVEVLFNEVPIVIRLEHIDCPKKKQPYGNKAKQFTSDFAFGKTVHVMSTGKKDRWGRLIAVIEFDNKNLNKELIKNGLAMHFKKYSKDVTYDALEIQAKKEKIGMWSQTDMVAPWVYRKN